MKKQVFNAVLPVMALACAVLAAKPGHAQLEGCDPRVMTAMQATAQARVAHSKSVDDEIYEQGDSVLALTCYNQSASIAAVQSGRRFSGDYRDDLAPVIEDGLLAMYGNFDEAIGKSSGAVDYDHVLPGGDPTYACGAIANMIRTINEGGIKTTVPYVSFEDLQLGNANAAGVPAGQNVGLNYFRSWNAGSSQAAFSNMNAAVTNLPVPEIPAFDNPDASPCEVLEQANLPVQGCQ